jgi:hypothetical protein
LWIVIIFYFQSLFLLQSLFFLRADKYFFGFLPQEQLSFFNFQVQANNDFSYRKNKKKALFLGVFDIFYKSIV